MHCRYQAVTAYEPLEPEAPPNLHAGVSVKKKNKKTFPNIIKSEDHTHLASSLFCGIPIPFLPWS